MERRTTALVLHPADNIATALPLAAGAVVALEARGRLLAVTLVSDVPAGHKFALADLRKKSQ